MSDRKPRWRFILKAVAILASILLIGRAFAHYFGEVQRNIAGLDFRFLLAGLAVCVAYRVLNSCGWVMVLRAMRQPMPLARGMRLWLLSESMRWLPGGIWGFCSRVFQSTKCGIPPAIASASLPLELLLTLIAWTLVAGAGILGSGQAVNVGSFLSPRVLALGAAAVAVIGFAVAICAIKLPEGKLASKLKSLRDGLLTLRTVRLKPWLLLGVLAHFTILCVVNGVAFYLVLRSVAPGPFDLSAIVGINACGWLIGFLAIGAPGGIGVREAGSAFLLSSMMPPSQAIAASLLWRLVMIVDELLSLAGCLAPNLVRLGSRRALACEAAI